MPESTTVYSTEPKTNHKYDIISKTAYLIGVPEHIFKDETKPPRMEWYEKLNNDKNARIIRDLCILRTHTLKYFSKIFHAIKEQGKSIMTLPGYIPQDIMNELNDYGIHVFDNLRNPAQFLIMLNKFIKERINNCKGLFPDWMPWDYYSSLFLMPGEQTAAGVRQASETYYTNRELFPYTQYINWKPSDEEKNILYNDLWFMIVLYRHNGSEFKQKGLVSDVSNLTKWNIYTFVEASDKCTLIVDCENSDPYNLKAALDNLGEKNLKKINSIILFDDKHASSAWDLLRDSANIPVEHIEIQRIKEDKSLTDLKLAGRVYKEYYSNQVRSFILVSSDSDYWVLMEDLPDANFLVMAEHRKCSGTFVQAMEENGIFYCFLDDFYAKDGNALKDNAIELEFAMAFKNALDLDLTDTFHTILTNTRITMRDDEIKNYIKNTIKPRLAVEITDDNRVTLSFRRK